MKKRKDKKQDDITEITINGEEKPITDETVKQHIEQVQKEKELLKKAKPTPITPTLLDIGRIYGQVERTAPYVLQILNEEAARTGKKPYEILREWITNYSIIRYDTWNKMSVAELYEAFQILKEMINFAVNTFGTFAKTMFSTQMQTLTDIIEEAKKQTGGYTPEAKEKALHKLIESFEPIMNILSGLMTQNLAKMMGIKQQQTQLKIPVNITEEKE